MKFILMIIGYAAVSSWGLAIIKSAPQVKSAMFLAGLTLYGAGFLVWLVILRSYPLSIAFPVAAGSLVVVTQVIAVVMLKESLSPTHLFGVVLVIAGIGILSIGKVAS